MGVGEGELLAGKYRIERVLGRGGMGVVVAAHHLVLDELVAIKFLLPEALENADAVMRFEREARAAVKIKSEHVARVMDVGRLESGAPYMVMELLRGRDLGDLLSERGPLPLEDVVDYVLQAGEAIAEGHGLGIVHRDLKPPNLFLTHRADGSPCIKVLDFGISKITNKSSNVDHGMTSTDVIMGSPLYMSPEQLMSARDVDMSTDIWALGVICFELLTGRGPFVADTLPQLCMAINLAPPARLREFRQDLPLELETVLLRCLEKDRSKRYPTVAQLARDLLRFAPERARLSTERIERLARSAGFSAATPASPHQGPALPAPTPLPTDGATAAATNRSSETLAEFGHTSSGKVRSRLRVWAVLGALLLAGGAGAFTIARRPATDSAAASAPLPATHAPPAAVDPLPAPTLAPAPPPAEPPVAAPIEQPTSTSKSIASTPFPPAAPAAPRKRAPSSAPTHKPVEQSTAAPPESPDCNIPYFYDARGNKVFKKGCL